MEFLPILQTAAYTASIAAIVTVFAAAQSACLNVQEPGRRRHRRRRPRPYRPPIRYERFEFNLDDWPDSLVVNRLRYVIVKLDIYILISIDFPRQRFAKFFLIFGLIYVNDPIELSLLRS